MTGVITCVFQGRKASRYNATTAPFVGEISGQGSILCPKGPVAPNRCHRGHASLPWEGSQGVTAVAPRAAEDSMPLLCIHKMLLLQEGLGGFQGCKLKKISDSPELRIFLGQL